MSNFNDKIAEYTGDGIPAYNRKINEIIRKLNWLMGMRSINGKPITESDQGPVFDLAPASSQGPNPWATDPLGNQAGWSKIKVFDPTGLMFFDLYAWTGALLAKEDAPWLFDPANNQAGWIVCPNNTFWGTGQCQAGASCLNYQGATIISSSPGGNYVSPYWINVQPANRPITPPANCTPRFYLTAPDLNVFLGSGTVPSQPVYWWTVTTLQNGQPVPGGQFSFTYTISYDGNQFFSMGGNQMVASGVQVTLTFPVNPAGWVYDPSGIPGYSHGSRQWLYLFNGAVSQNTSPPIIHTLNWSTPGIADGHGSVFETTFMTA